MKSPKSSQGYSDRILDCEAALEMDFLALIDRAVAAGWGEVEAEEAILSLSQNRRWSRIANDRTDAAIDEAWEDAGNQVEN